MPVDPVRDAAIDVLLRVFEHGVFLDASLDKTLRRKDISERGRRFLTHLVYGTVRHKLLCDYILGPLVRHPLEELPRPIHAILRMGVYQALYLNQVTFPAMVHTSVDLAKKRGHIGVARLTNAVLKRVPQRLEDVRLPSRETDFPDYVSVRYSMPRWLVDLWRGQFGSETTEAICAASDVQAPTTIRTNTLKTSPEALAAALTKSDYVVEKRTPVPEELTILDGPPPVRSKLFQAGHFIIQDPSSMLPPHLLEPRPGDWVLDMSAAPGGKTTHLAQLSSGEARIVALDNQAHKLERVLENAARMGTPGIRLLCGDGMRVPLAPAFDRVLVDAPCTGLGTLRRHPELKWRLQPKDPDELATIQAQLLHSAIRLCKNGGLIVYSVCTFSTPETEGVARVVLNDGDALLEDGPEWLGQWKISSGQYRILPQEDGMDGFFLMRLRKRS